MNGNCHTNNPLLNGLNLSLEDIDGKVHVEREFTIYAHMIDLSQLDDCESKETHEQWKLPLASDKVRARLRLIDDRRHTMAVKKPLDGDSMGCYEVESDISPDMYKFLRLVSTDGYKKIRYNKQIPNSNLKWEIDVFFDQTGNPHPWVKIDMEIDINKDAFPKFPFDLSEIIIMDDELTNEQKSFIDNLWNVEWTKLDSAREDLDVVYR